MESPLVLKNIMEEARKALPRRAKCIIMKARCTLIKIWRFPENYRIREKEENVNALRRKPCFGISSRIMTRVMTTNLSV